MEYIIVISCGITTSIIVTFIFRRMINKRLENLMRASESLESLLIQLERIEKRNVQFDQQLPEVLPYTTPKLTQTEGHTIHKSGFINLFHSLEAGISGEILKNNPTNKEDLWLAIKTWFRNPKCFDKYFGMFKNESEALIQSAALYVFEYFSNKYFPGE